MPTCTTLPADSWCGRRAARRDSKRILIEPQRLRGRERDNNKYYIAMILLSPYFMT